MPSRSPFGVDVILNRQFCSYVVLQVLVHVVGNTDSHRWFGGCVTLPDRLNSTGSCIAEAEIIETLVYGLILCTSFTIFGHHQTISCCVSRGRREGGGERGFCSCPFGLLVPWIGAWEHIIHPTMCSTHAMTSEDRYSCSIILNVGTLFYCILGFFQCHHPGALVYNRACCERITSRSKHIWCGGLKYFSRRRFCYVCAWKYILFINVCGYLFI